MMDRFRYDVLFVSVAHKAIERGFKYHEYPPEQGGTLSIDFRRGNQYVFSNLLTDRWKPLKWHCNDVRRPFDGGIVTWHDSIDAALDEADAFEASYNATHD